MILFKIKWDLLTKHSRPVLSLNLLKITSNNISVQIIRYTGHNKLQSDYLFSNFLQKVVVKLENTVNPLFLEQNYFQFSENKNQALFQMFQGFQKALENNARCAVAI